jgi:transcriptional/translational regulatory protein YebC/TACO1
MKEKPWKREAINDDALNSDLDDIDWEDESGEVVGDATAKRKFDSQLETLLRFNTAGPENTSLPKRFRETWLQLMKDDRYRLQKVLDAWDSASDMEKCLRKAAVGELRRASTMQAFRFTPGFSLVGTFGFFEN